MATIEEREDGYSVRWRELETTRNEDGSVSRVWKSRRRQCPDMKTAKALKLEIEQRTAKGDRWQPEYEKPRPTLDAIAVAYLKDRQRALGARTVVQYSNALELFLRFMHEREGDRPLYPDLLTKALLGELYDWLLAGKGRIPPHDRPHQRVNTEPRKPQTARKNTEVVRVMWAWAADSDEYIEDMPRPRSIEYPDEEIDPTIAPTWAEMDACVEAARGWVRKLAIVLRFTGLRVQQAMALTWDDIDLDAQTLRIRGALGKSPQEKRGRIVPISPHLAAELAGWGVREGYVVPIVRQPTKADAGTERLARGRDMARAWRRAGVAEDRWRGQPDHAFRKGIVSGLKLLGADGEAVEYVVGHARESVRGAYLDPDFLPNREAVARIPAIGASNADVRRLRAK